MDLFKILRFYVEKMLKEVPGMKVLVLDEETTQSVSMVYSQSEILEQEVFLVEKLETQAGEKLHHLKVGFLVCPWARHVLPNPPSPHPSSPTGFRGSAKWQVLLQVDVKLAGQESVPSSEFTSNQLC